MKIQTLAFRILALTALALSSALATSAFASGKNVVVCGWNDNDDSVTIREDVGGQLVALFSMVDHGTEAYSVEENSAAAESVGAERVYQGRGIELKVSGSSSALTISSMGIKDEAFDCKTVN